MAFSENVGNISGFSTSDESNRSHKIYFCQAVLLCSSAAFAMFWPPPVGRVKIKICIKLVSNDNSYFELSENFLISVELVSRVLSLQS